MTANAPVPVSRLVALLREVVEENFLDVFVEGEISNFSVPASGHWYFTLKDGDAQLRTVFFRAQNRLLRFVPENGLKIVCRGRVSVYPQRGELQFVAESLEPAGLGGLQLAYEQLKIRLAGEGLFADELKRPLPADPAVIGVVTSATGAAIHDILQVLRRRGAGVQVILAPARVQGEGAAAEIAAAIGNLNRDNRADVLIVGRGGGSLEDLWAFNEEAVARAIRASHVPVIAAIGHETDVTIADFAADLRAPTPSAAAELVARGRLERQAHLDRLQAQLAALMAARLQSLTARFSLLAGRLRSPVERLAGQRREIDRLAGQLDRAAQRQIMDARTALAGLCGRLELLSPLATLGRGYALVRTGDGRIVRHAAEVAPGETIDVTLAHGRITARVHSVEVDS